MSKVTTYRDARTNAEKIVDEEIKEQVLVAIERLTEVYGADWVDFVDPGSLAMADGNRCVLGQLERKKHGIHSGYSAGAQRLGLDPWAESTAFYARDGIYAKLNKAWKFVLTTHEEERARA